MNNNYEQEQRSQHQYTGYNGNTNYTHVAQETSHFYEPPENPGNYSGDARQEQQEYQAYQPYQAYQQQPVQVFVQFSQGQSFTKSAPSDGSNIAAALSYVFGWFTGILCLIFGFGNRFVRFHALQSILFFGAVNLFDIVFMYSFIHLRLLAYFHYMEGFAILFFLFINFLAFVGWLIALFQSARGAYFKLPIVGAIVEHITGNQPYAGVK